MYKSHGVNKELKQVEAISEKHDADPRVRGRIVAGVNIPLDRA